MKFFACSFIATLLAFGTRADESPKNPQETALLDSNKFLPGLCHAWPSSDLGIGPRMLRVMYAGYNALMTEDEEKASSLKINIYKWDKAPSQRGEATIIDTQTVHHKNVSKPWFFTFNVPENEVEKNKYYSVGFCVERDGRNVKCSEASEPATAMVDIGVDNKINCEEAGHQDTDIVNINQMADDSVITALRDANPDSLAHKYGVEKPLKRFTKNGKQMIYAAPVYDLSSYKAILTDEANEFCRSKYQVSLLVHLVDPTNSQVMLIHRMSPYLSPAAIEEYVVNRPRPIPMETILDVSELMKDTDIDNYEIQFTVCYDNTKTVGSVRCSKPYKKQVPTLE